MDGSIVGRDAVLADGWQALVGCGAVLIDGLAGIGKTAVWLELVARAQRAGWLVLSCAPTESESALPCAATSAGCDVESAVAGPNRSRGGWKPTFGDRVDSRGEPTWLAGTVPAIWWGLTDDHRRATEEKVARLAAQGQTNRDIAGALSSARRPWKATWPGPTANSASPSAPTSVQPSLTAKPRETPAIERETPDSSPAGPT